MRDKDEILTNINNNTINNNDNSSEKKKTTNNKNNVSNEVFVREEGLELCREPAGSVGLRHGHGVLVRDEEIIYNIDNNNDNNNNNNNINNKDNTNNGVLVRDKGLRKGVLRQGRGVLVHDQGLRREVLYICVYVCVYIYI